MIDKIFYNLIYIEEDQNTKLDIIDRIEQLPKKIIDNKTKQLIQVLNKIIESGQEIDKTTVNTYFTFYKQFDPDDYFWDTNEQDASSINLKASVKLYIKEKIQEHNDLNFSQALENFRLTGDQSFLTNVEIKESEEKQYVQNSNEFMRKTLVKLDNLKSGNDLDVIKLSNKFFHIQMATKGLGNGELILIAARPSVGKSALGIALLNDLSKNYKTLFVSYEMTSEEIGMRMVQAKSAVSSNTLYSKKGFTDEVYLKVYTANQRLAEQQIKIIDEPPRSFLELRQILRKEKKRGLDVVIIDYLGLIKAFAPNDKWDPYITTSQISGELKMLAKELNLPIIALQQVNRAVTGSNREEASQKELQLTDLRDSGSLEQDANKVFLIWNKKPETELEKQRYQDNEQDIIIFLAKNRNGLANQKFRYIFNKTYQRIYEPKREEQCWLNPPSWWDTGGGSNE